MVDNVSASIKWIFTKGFARGKGTNRVPESFALDLRNVRLTNWGITQRPGHALVFDGSSTTAWTGITYNTTNQELHCVHSNIFKTIDIDWASAVSEWAVDSTTTHRFIDYWAYTIILTGAGRPYYYNRDGYLTFDANLVTSNAIDMDVNGVAMTTVNFNTDNNTTLDDIATQLQTQFTEIATATRNASNDGVDITVTSWYTVFIDNIAVTGGASQANGSWTRIQQTTSTHIPANHNPSFGARFAWFTVVNSNLNPNAIIFSRPIDIDNQNYCFYWDYNTANGAESITYDGRVLGLIWSTNKLRIFTSTTVEYVDRDNVSTVGGVASVYSTILGRWEELASPDAAVAAWDSVFFFTKGKRPKTINYKQGTLEPNVADLWNREDADIDYWLNNFLADDQSSCEAEYIESSSIIVRHLKSAQTDVNDVFLVYSILYDTFLIDDRKYYKNYTRVWEKVYWLSSLDFSIYQDETGFDDDWDGVDRYFETQNLNTDKKRPIDLATRTRAIISWQINEVTVLTIDIYVDGSLVFTQDINGSDYAYSAVSTIGSQAIGEEAIGWEIEFGDDLVDFEVEMTRLRRTGKRIKLRFSGNVAWQDVVLDYLELWFFPRGRNLVSDKV